MIKRYRVVVIEWLTHDAVIEAASKEEAQAKGLDLWNRADGEVFSFDDQGVDGVTAEELPS